MWLALQSQLGECVYDKTYCYKQNSDWVIRTDAKIERFVPFETDWTVTVVGVGRVDAGAIGRALGVRI